MSWKEREGRRERERERGVRESGKKKKDHLKKTDREN